MTKYICDLVEDKINIPDEAAETIRNMSGWDRKMVYMKILLREGISYVDATVLSSQEQLDGARRFEGARTDTIYNLTKTSNVLRLPKKAIETAGLRKKISLIIDDKSRNIFEIWPEGSYIRPKKVVLGRYSTRKAPAPQPEVTPGAQGRASVLNTYSDGQS